MRIIKVIVFIVFYLAEIVALNYYVFSCLIHQPFNIFLSGLIIVLLLFPLVTVLIMDKLEIYDWKWED